MLPRCAAVVTMTLVAAACSSSTTTTTTTTTTPTTAAPTTSTSVPPATTTLPDGSAVAPEVETALREQVAELARSTEEIRGLRFLEEPQVEILSEEELAARVQEDFLADLEPGEIEWTEAWLDLLGLLDPEAQPLLQLYLDLIGEQVIGLYDADTRTMLVRGDAEELSALSKATVVHELLHALTDQHFEIDARLNELVDTERFDEAAAYASLLEGEATYFQFIYITEYMSRAEAVELALETLDTDTSVLDVTPYSISEPLFFRYEDGLDFALRLAEERGIEGFNQAHLSPPTSTEQIAHPERYLEPDPPMMVELPVFSVAGYEAVEEATWGELGLLATFGQVIGQGAADQIGDGWGGDTYRVLTSGDEVVFAVTLRADTERDAQEMADAFVTLAEVSMDAGEATQGDDGSYTFSGEDYAFIDIAGDTVVFIAASDGTAGSVVAGVLDLGQA